jgi:NAD(P)H-dependent FMN reductase
MIATPEYNGSITAVLKNALDWISRPGPGEPALIAFDHKVGAVMSASPGIYGGIRSHALMCALLQYFKVLVLPDQVALSFAHEAFTMDGNLKDIKLQARVEGLGVAVADLIKKGAVAFPSAV